MIETILKLEKQGITFAPRPYGFDYILRDPLTIEQAEAIIRLKEMDREVCRYLIGCAKVYVRACRGLLGGQ